MDVDDVVEAQRLAVLHEHLEHGGVDARLAPLGVRMAEVAQVLDAGRLEVRQVAAVVDDGHRVGLGEAHPEAVGERVVLRLQGRLDGNAHHVSVPGDAWMLP